MGVLRLLGYEFHKVYRSKLYIALLIGTLLANGALFYSDQFQGGRAADVRSQGAYREQLARYQQMPLDAAYRQIADWEAQYDILLQLSLPGLPEETIEDYAQRYPDIVQAYRDRTYPQFSGDLMEDYAIVEKLHAQLRHAAAYEDFLNKIDAQADDLTGFSIFAAQGSFSNKSILKTAREFGRLHGVGLRLANTGAIDRFTLFGTTDVLALFLLFLLCVLLMTQEKERDLFGYLRVMRYGRSATILCKMLFLALNCAGVAVLFYGGNLAVSAALYGWTDLSLPVQSSALFMQCAAPMSFGQYLWLFFALKAAALLAICMMLVFFLLWIKNTPVCYGIVSAIVVASYLAYRLIDANSIWNHFKFVNILCFLDAAGLFTHYQNLNFFTHHIGIKATAMVCLPVLLGALSAAAAYFYLRNIQHSLAFLSRLADGIQRFFSRFWLHHRISLYEMRRILVSHKGILIVLAMAYLLYAGVQNSFLSLEPKYKIYRNYIQQWGGELTDETLAKVEEEQACFDSLGGRQSALEQQLREGTITQRQYDGKTAQLTYYAQKAEGFQIVRRQVETLRGVRDGKGTPVWLLDNLGYNRLFAVESYGEDIANMLLAMLVLILLGSNMFSYDNHLKTAFLLNSTRRGKAFLAGRRFLVLAALALGVTICVYGVQLYDVARLYGLPGLQAPVQSVVALGRLDGRLSILGFIVLSDLIRLASLLLISAGTLLISKYARNAATAVIIALMLFGSPVIIYFIGLRAIAPYSLFPFLSANYLFLSCGVAAANGAPLFLALLLGLTVLLAWALCLDIRIPPARRAAPAQGCGISKG